MPFNTSKGSAFHGAVFVGILLLLLVGGPAHAVTNIRDVFWPIENANVPTTSRHLTLVFDADITSGDATNLQFSVLEMNSQEALVDFSYAMQGQSSVSVLALCSIKSSVSANVL